MRGMGGSRKNTVEAISRGSENEQVYKEHGGFHLFSLRQMGEASFDRLRTLRQPYGKKNLPSKKLSLGPPDNYRELTYSSEPCKGLRPGSSYALQM